MHELSIMQSALEQALAKAREAGARQVHEIRLRVGALSGVVPEALQMAFEALTAGTLAERAVLKIEDVPARYWCVVCDREFASVKQLRLDGVQLMLIIENVGNLVCPASYDLGEDLRVVLLSVTEGEDKPLKYPPMFQSAGAVVVSKVDLAQACDYNRETARTNLQRLAPGAPIFELSAKNGAGMTEWCEFLIQQHAASNARDLVSG